MKAWIFWRRRCSVIEDSEGNSWGAKVTSTPEVDTLLRRTQKRIATVRARLREWRARGKALWHFIFWTATTFALALLLAYFFCFELTKSLSTMLELVGVGYVFRQIGAKRKNFGKPTVFKAAISWLRDLMSVFEKPKTISISGNAILGNITSTARGRVTNNPISNSIFDRVDALEKNMERLRTEVDEVYREADNSKAELKSKLQDEIHQRAIKDNRNLESLKDVSVSDSELEYLGLIFVALGAVLNNMLAVTASIFSICLAH